MAKLTDDEKAWSLYEIDYLTPNGKEYRRKQCIRVQRGERLVEFTLDLGLASNWSCGNFTIVSMNENTVGQVRESALFLREENAKLVDNQFQEHMQEENLFDQLLREAEQMAEWQRRNPHTIRNLRQQTNKKDRPLLFPVTNRGPLPYRK